MQIEILNSVEELFESITSKELGKVLRTVDLLEEFGKELGLPHSRHLKDGLLELRIRGKREIRVFYCFKKQKIILLHAFIKKKQKTPFKELKRARKIKDVLRSYNI